MSYAALPVRPRSVLASQAPAMSSPADEHPVDAGSCGAAPRPHCGSEVSPVVATPEAEHGKEQPLEVKTEESTDIGLAEETPPEDPGEDFYPEGGTTAWLQVVAMHLMSCLAWGYASTFGVYQTHYTETMNLPRSQISWIGSVQIFLTFAMCTVSGRLSDAGFNHATVAAGGALAVFGTFMTSLATEYWQILLAQGICTGIGLGLLFMPGIAIVSSYFKRKRAFALAVAATGTGTGSIAFPACVQYLVPRVGFPWAVRCSAFVALAFSAVAVALLRPRLKPRRSGPLVEWGAFREAPYILFTLGLFIWFWAHYFGFFYVSCLPPALLTPTSSESRITRRLPHGKRKRRGVTASVMWLVSPLSLSSCFPILTLPADPSIHPRRAG
ncbi:MFS transporter, partial [Candidatus Bathyarchaeota archaeon]|nr:MFS transporter [Candidatus Bathyarchaeota archaeon]